MVVGDRGRREELHGDLSSCRRRQADVAAGLLDSVLAVSRDVEGHAVWIVNREVTQHLWVKPQLVGRVGIVLQMLAGVLLALADAGKVRQEGFSMLDMKNFLGAEGYQADGIRLPLKGLREQVRLPTIVLLNLNGFRHFVVIKGINDKEVLVGDPARGVNAYSHQEFEESWDGTAFVIRNHLETGRRAFSTEEDWAQVTRAPLQEGLVEPPVGHTLPYWPSTQEW